MLRFIPARAGDSERDSSAAPVTGASPRVRGGRVVDVRPRCPHWCIPAVPARAGLDFTRSRRSSRHLVTLAPRGPIVVASPCVRLSPLLRGGAGRAQESHRSCGTSPRRRGTRGLNGADPSHDRFIPAGAWHTSSAPLQGPSGPAASPLPRGRRLTKLRSDPTQWSIPARAGETRSRMVSPFERFRFIPARAGETGQVQHATRWNPVHPRARGADGRLGWKHIERSGSSPRVRSG